MPIVEEASWTSKVRRVVSEGPLGAAVLTSTPHVPASGRSTLTAYIPRSFSIVHRKLPSAVATAFPGSLPRSKNENFAVRSGALLTLFCASRNRKSIRDLPHATEFETRTGISCGAAAGGPHALMSDTCGAVWQSAGNWDPAACDAGADDGEVPVEGEQAVTIAPRPRSRTSRDRDGRRGVIARSVPKTARTCARHGPSVIER